MNPTSDKPRRVSSITDLDDGDLVYDRGGRVYELEDGSLRRRRDIQLEDARTRGAVLMPRP